MEDSLANEQGQRPRGIMVTVVKRPATPPATSITSEPVHEPAHDDVVFDFQKFLKKKEKSHQPKHQPAKQHQPHQTSVQSQKSHPFFSVFQNEKGIILLLI